MLSRLLGYLITIVMVALVLDGLLRLTPLGPQTPVVEFNADTGWAKKTDTTVHRSTGEFKVDYHLNSKGLRGPETPYEKPAGVKRILVVGDSFVQGFSVQEEKLFLRVLEHDLRSRGEKVEVLNGGTEAFSTDQEFVWLQNEGLKYRPDIVVLAPYQNDVFWNAQDHYFEYEKPLFRVDGATVTRVNPRLEPPPAESWWKKHTAIGSVIKLIQKAQQQPSLMVNGKSVITENAVVLKEEPVILAQPWQITAALLQAFANSVKDAGAVPVLLLVPNRWEIHHDPTTQLGGLPDSEFEFARPRERFAQIGKAAGFTVIDPEPKLAEHAKNGERLYFHTDWHWNERGNHVVADALRAGLAEAGLIAASDAAAAKTDTPYVPLAAAEKGIPTWAFVVGGLWLLLSILYWRSYPEENAVLSFVKVGVLVAFVAGVFLGVGMLASSLPPAIGGWVTKAIFVFLIGFILVKIAKRLGVIGELYGTFLRRGHWYMLPLIVVMISIGMLLVVAASSPFVAPFIYTLF